MSNVRSPWTSMSARKCETSKSCSQLLFQIILCLGTIFIKTLFQNVIFPLSSISKEPHYIIRNPHGAVRCLSRHTCLSRRPEAPLWFPEPHGGKRDLRGNQKLSGYHTYIPQHTCSPCKQMHTSTQNNDHYIF